MNGAIFRAVHEAKVLIEQRRRHDNAVRPHSFLGYRPLAPETLGVRAPHAAAWPALDALRPARQRGERHRTL